MISLECTNPQDPHSAQDDEKEMSDEQGPTTQKGRKNRMRHLKVTHRRNKIPQVMQVVPASKTKSRLLKNQRTVTSNKMPLHSDPTTKEKTESVSESHEAW